MIAYNRLYITFIIPYVNYFQVGREMLYNDSLVISLTFLLFNDVKQAFTVCKQIESKAFIKPNEVERFR